MSSSQSDSESSKSPPSGFPEQFPVQSSRPHSQQKCAPQEQPMSWQPPFLETMTWHLGCSRRTGRVSTSAFIKSSNNKEDVRKILCCG